MESIMKLDKELIKGTSAEFNRELKEYKKNALRLYKDFLVNHSNIHPDVIRSIVKTLKDDIDLEMEVLFEKCID